MEGEKISKFYNPLIIPSARDVTCSHIENEIYTILQSEVSKNGHLHLVAILHGMADRVSEEAEIALASLLTSIDPKNKQGLFTYWNPAYQAVVRVVREWPKSQRHAHIGESIHEGFAWNEMICYHADLWDEFVQICAKYGKVPDNLVEAKEKGSLWHEVDAATQLKFIELYKIGKLGRGEFGLYENLDSWGRAIQHVVMQHFADGVRDLFLLIYLDRKFDNNSKPQKSERIKTIIKSFDSAEKRAEENWGGKFRVSLVVSFPRHENPPNSCIDYVAYVEEQVMDLIQLRKENENRERIVGIDFSGAEMLIDDPSKNVRYRKTSDFQKAIDDAKTDNMIVMAHLGDLGHTHKSTDNLPIHPTARSQEPKYPKRIVDVLDREERIRHHLIFVDDGIRALLGKGKNSGSKLFINHGTILAPEGSSLTKDPQIIPDVPPLAGYNIQNKENKDLVRKLLEEIRDNGIEICTCPTANTNSWQVEFYRKHPFFQWLMHGVKTTINVDDFYWGKVRSTLSDDIAKMMLAAPENSSFTPQLAREICKVPD